MHKLGHTRSASHRDHLLHTPDTFVRVAQPFVETGAVIVHASPACGARFTQYTVELEAQGMLLPAAAQRFVYLLKGEAQIVLSTDADAPATYSLHAGSFAYLPQGADATLTATTAAQVAAIEKAYVPHPTLKAPEARFGHVDAAPASALMGDPDLVVRTLLPDSQAFDFAVNVMTYQPGASLPMVEVHVMEHGCLMLEGGGIYRLGEHWYPVTQGDFIWMAPYCPQWFGAIGKEPAVYLIYKDLNRHPLEGVHLP